MATFWDKVKKSGSKTKLRGEILLMDRDIINRQKAFGIELYDRLSHFEKTSNNPFQSLSILNTSESVFKSPYEGCRYDINDLLDKKDAKQVELEKLQVKQDRAPPARNNTEKMQNVGTAIADSGTMTKLRAQIALLDRDIKIRKERFGTDLFDSVTTTTAGGGGGGSLLAGAARTGISGALNQLSSNEKELQRIIETAESDIDIIRKQVESKLREIERLDREMAT